MCGIAAVVGENVDLKSYDTTSMLKALESRGPDGSDTQIFFGCWLGHRRLAIIDLENGNQPMKDNELTIIYNGEIYNYQKLRKQLEKDGYIFRTQSDTEVIIKAYRKWGTGCPKKFDGMFAFAIWDDEKKELFIARDRLGIKPLYYYMDGKTLLLASEIKSLINSGKVKPQIDLRSIDEYLGLMYIKPPRTIYKDVYQFPAANYGFFRKGELNFKKYWELKHEPINIAYDEAKAKVHALLTAAVEKRLIASDVEIGSFLSGGVDSSIVTMMAAKKLNQPIKLFTVSYASHDELPYAKEVNKIINGQQYVLDIPRCSTSEFNKTINILTSPMQIPLIFLNN
jgi:asparagine synthase (glutamine-hydrolysing)